MALLRLRVKIYVFPTDLEFLFTFGLILIFLNYLIKVLSVNGVSLLYEINMFWVRFWRDVYVIFIFFIDSETQRL